MGFRFSCLRNIMTAMKELLPLEPIRTFLEK